MASSQGSYPYDRTSLDELKRVISAGRFGPYLSRANGNERYAIALYLYNARLAKSMMFPIQMAEVTLRNQIDALFVETYGQDWPNSITFQGLLLRESLDALQRAKARLFREKGSGQPRGQLVSTLTFDFWSNLFRADYDRDIWQGSIASLLQNAPHSVTRDSFQIIVRSVYQYRNRISHFEPVITQNTSGVYHDACLILKYISEKAYNWVKAYSTVGVEIRSAPNKKGQCGPSLKHLCDKHYVSVDAKDSVMNLDKNSMTNRHVPIIVRSSSQILGIISVDTVLNYLVDKARILDGLINIAETSFGDMATKASTSSYEIYDAEDSIVEALEAFRNKAEFILVKDAKMSGNLIGYISRPHRTL